MESVLMLVTVVVLVWLILEEKNAVAFFSATILIPFQIINFICLQKWIYKSVQTTEEKLEQIDRGNKTLAEFEVEIANTPFLMDIIPLIKHYLSLKINRNNAEIFTKQTELTALQSQINPHFLYNTLESITWMVEAQKNEEAVIMISELAKLLRVSLSRGKTIIPVKDELQHSRSYMNIQLMRYKERFQIEFQTDKEIEDYCIVKLVIQPILENAIYYGVGNMDEDDEGKITVRGEKKEDDIYIIIEDNGMGMRKEVLENILKDNNKVPKHGSGVGVINVHNRIQLMFGEEYGLKVESEADEGTKVTIHIPAIPFNSENQSKMEEKSVERKGKNEKE